MAVGPAKGPSYPVNPLTQISFSAVLKRHLLSGKIFPTNEKLKQSVKEYCLAKFIPRHYKRSHSFTLVEFCDFKNIGVRFIANAHFFVFSVGVS